MTRTVAAAALAALALALLVPAAPSTAAPGDETRLREMLNRLDSTLVNLDLEDTPLEDALKVIARFTRVNLVVSPKLRDAAAAAELTYTLKLHEVSARQALRILVEFKDLGVVYRHGVLMVTTKQDARGMPVLRIYSIADLTFPIRDFPGPDLQLKPAGTEFTEEEIPDREDPFENPDFIADLVRTNVAPETWEDEGVSIQAYKKVLIVRQSPAAHAQIARLLDLLRAAK